MNAEVKIEVGVQGKQRYHDEPFKPTRTWTDAFSWTTDLTSYLTETPTIASSIYSYISAARARGAETQTHIAIRLDNPTHPVPGKGVVPLPKSHIDFGFTDLNVESSSVIQTTLEEKIGNMKNTAKY